MSNRIKGFTIALDRDYREEAAEQIENAIAMIKGVVKVTEHIVTAEDFFAETKVKRELLEKIWNVVK